MTRTVGLAAVGVGVRGSPVNIQQASSALSFDGVCLCALRPVLPNTDVLYRTAKRQDARLSLLANLILEFRRVFDNLIEI
jgi:hypothetical protein